MSNANPTPEDKGPTTSNDALKSDSNIYFTSLNATSKMVLKSCLDSWEMSSLYEPCIDGHLGMRDLHDINNFVIAYLYNKYSMGLQLEFERHIKDGRMKQAPSKRKKDTKEPSGSSSSSSKA